MSVVLLIKKDGVGKWHANESAQQTSDVKIFRAGEWFSLFFLSPGLSHQQSDVPRVQPLRSRHGQQPVELQDV